MTSWGCGLHGDLGAFGCCFKVGVGGHTLSNTVVVSFTLLALHCYISNLYLSQNYVLKQKQENAFNFYH